MKKSVLMGAITVLGITSAMAGSIANFTNANEQVNPYASQNAQIAKQTVTVAKQTVTVAKQNHGKINPKETNPLYQYTGASTASDYQSHASAFAVNH